MLTLFLTFLIQEPISSSLALARALYLDISPFTIHLLYLAATSIDISVGYIVGTYLKKHQEHRALYKYFKNKLSYVFPDDIPLQKHFGVFLLGPLIFPITTFLTPLIGISFSRSFIILLTSEIIFWYTSVWGIVLGITSKEGISFLHILLVIPMICIVLLSRFFKKSDKQKSI